MHDRVVRQTLPRCLCGAAPSAMAYGGPRCRPGWRRRSFTRCEAAPAREAPPSLTKLMGCRVGKIARSPGHGVGPQSMHAYIRNRKLDGAWPCERGVGCRRVTAVEAAQPPGQGPERRKRCKVGVCCRSRGISRVCSSGGRRHHELVPAGGLGAGQRGTRHGATWLPGGTPG